MAGHQRKGPGRRKNRVVTTAGRGQWSEKKAVQLELRRGRSESRLGLKRGGPPVARRPGGESKGLGRVRDRCGMALSPGQMLQDLLLNDPGHAGAASRVESKWAAVASSAVKKQLLTSPRRGNWMPRPWRSPAPAGALYLRRDPTHLRGAVGVCPERRRDSAMPARLPAA